MTSRRLRAWARALKAADERDAQEYFLVLATGVCLAALAVIAGEMVVHWPSEPMTLSIAETAGAHAGKDIAERIKFP